MKSYSNLLLYISLALLVLSFGFFNFLQSKELESLQESGYVSEKVHSILKSSTQDLENQLSTIVKGTNQISKVEAYNAKNIDGYKDVFQYAEYEKPNFQLSKSFNFSPPLVDFFPSGNGDGDWYVITERRSFHTLSVLVLLLGLAFYWFSFTVWSLKKAYDQKRLNIGWALVFVLFNVIGYLVFHLFNNRINSNHSFFSKRA